MALINTIKREKNGQKDPTRAYSKKQEDYVAKKFGGDRVKNSGATMFEPGDVKLDYWLLECKTKMADSHTITIHKEWLEKLKQEALFSGKPHEALIFNFGPNQKNYVIIDELTFHEIVDLLK